MTGETTIRSMTSFGRSSLEVAGTSWEVTLKSLNHKYNDLKLSLPFELEHLDPKVRRLVKERYPRGTVSLSITHRSHGGAVVPVERFERLGKELTDLAERLGIEAPVSLDTLLTATALFQGAGLAATELPSDEAVLSTVAEAVARAVRASSEEGARLRHALEGILDELEGYVARIVEALPTILPELHGKVRERVERIIGAADGMDPHRLEQEVVMLTQKADITEEVDRIASHATSFRGILAGGGERVGQRLEFLVNELQREVSTAAAKASSLGLVDDFIEAKLRIERLKEQVRNVS